MPRLLLLANPAASGFTGGLHRDVMTILKQGYEVQAAWPTDTREASQQARRAVTDGIDVVVAMGGDGVVHHLANVLVGTSTALGIIPAGTTNVLADILHIPSRPTEAAEYLLQATQPQTVGVLRVTLDGAPPVFATFSAGVGLDAEVVESAEQRPARKTHFGWIHYGRSTLDVVLRRFRHRLPTLRVDTGGQTFDAVTVLAQAHWPYSYFGRVPLTFAKHPPDGMHLAVFETLPLTTVADIGLRVLTGSKLKNARGVHVIEDAETATIVADPPALIQADGELLGRATSIELTADPDALTVMAPAFRPTPKPVRTRRRLRKTPKGGSLTRDG